MNRLGMAGNITGNVSLNGVVGGLLSGSGVHSTGSDGIGVPSGAMAAIADFFDVKTVTAPVAAPILSTSLLVKLPFFFVFLEGFDIINLLSIP
jgi:hypothetical protein